MWWRKKGRWGLPVQYEEGWEHGAGWMLSVVTNALGDSSGILSWFWTWHGNLKKGEFEKYREGVQHIQEYIQKHTGGNNGRTISAIRFGVSDNTQEESVFLGEQSLCPLDKKGLS